MASGGEEYKNIEKLFTFPSMYFAFIFFICAFVLLEVAITMCGRAMKVRKLAKIEEKERQLAVIAASAKDIVTLKLTEYKHTGYAFSGAAGQDHLITGSLIEDAKNTVEEKLKNVLGGLGLTNIGIQSGDSPSLQVPPQAASSSGAQQFLPPTSNQA